MPTIGVAVPIPEPYASFLQERREAYGDPLAHAIPAHVTLLPPTQVSAAEYGALEAHLMYVATAHRPFTIALESTATFRPISPVVFVQLVAGGAECAALQADIRNGPVPRELEFDFHPHVTIAHNVSDAELDAAFADLKEFTATFRVPAIELYHHGEDHVWRPARAFELQGE